MSERPQILLVDDEPDILVALEDLFEADYEVLTAGSGAEALQLLARHAGVAVIVSDQRMPQMTGDVFLREARGLSDAPAILLTGYADLSAVVAALNDGGIVGYAAKPWEPEGLKAMVAGAAERRRLARALARERALLQGLMDHIPAEVSLKDRDGRLLQVNRQKAEGGRAPTGSDATLTQDEAQVLRTREAIRSVVETTVEADPRWTEIETVPILGIDGEVDSLVVVSRDITAQKVAEIHARQTDKLRALGTLAGGVAHDFNNLLTAIIGSLDLAGRRFGDHDALRRYLDNALQAAHRGAALTQRLLGFSRQTDSRAVLTQMPDLLLGLKDLMSQTLGPGVEVAWDIPDDLCACIVEPDQLELALLNLAVNARDAVEGEGRISIRARNMRLDDPDERLALSPGPYVLIEIEDDGHGMAPETLSRVMEPFFTTKPTGKGTGLGLPMAYAFAQRSGGAIDLESHLGAGTTVRLLLPCTDATEVAVTPAAEPSPARESRRLCVLVVDDEAIVREVTADFLRERGHRVLEAANGVAALELFHKHREEIDLAVVDFAMPGMSGVDFAVAARTRRDDLPVILLTGYFDIDVVPSDISIMHKPFTDSGLLEAISDAVSLRTPKSE